MHYLLLETFQKNRKNVEIITCLNNLNDRLAVLINTAKRNYYSNIVKKLQNTQRSSNAYWSLLKIFLNNKKIPIIPPLYHKNEFVIDFKKKGELFNSFFADQCSLMSNSSEFPSKFKYLTPSRLSSITFQGRPQSVSLWKLFLIDVWRRVLSQMTGKKAMLFPSSKKTINKFTKTTVQSRYFLCVVKYFRN